MHMGEIRGLDRPGRQMTTGEMSREHQVSLRTLRFYEDRGLLHPLRDGVSRLYSNHDRLSLRFILRCRRLGFTLSQIHDMLDKQLFEGETPGLDLSRDKKVEAQITHLERRRREIDEALTELRRYE
jgi:DNA-binding transcriptional MerR regulator